MSEYKDKFDDLTNAAKRKARELDEKLGVSGIVEDTARVAGDAAPKRSLRARNICAPKPDGWPTIRSSARTRAKRLTKPNVTRRKPARLFAMQPLTRERLFATRLGQPGKKLKKSSMKRPATWARRRRWPAKE